MAGGALVQIDSVRRTGYGYDERIEVFGSAGMVESRRQHFRGVSRSRGNQIIQDGLHAGWFERVEGQVLTMRSMRLSARFEIEQRPNRRWTTV